MTKIGFVGLGHMGLPMAINLIHAGCSVTGFDLNSNALKNFQAAGGKIAPQLQEVAKNQDVLITMLQTGSQVQEVTLGPQGLFHHAKADCLYIDCSTIDVQTSRLVLKEATQRGIEAIDAPVSGGVAGARAKTLTFMVGGEQSSLERASPILLNMGKTIIHTGDSGTGEAAKICNNMILGISMIAISEAFLLAEQLGLSPQKLFEVVNHASGQCWTMSHYVPVAGVLPNVPANDAYQPGFSAKMMLKDLLLSQECANTSNLNTPMAALATQLYHHNVEHGQGELDFSAIIQTLQRK